MKMAEQPSEVPAETLPTTNDDSAAEKQPVNTDDTDVSTIENGPNEIENAGAPETVAQETVDDKETDQIGVDNGEDKEPCTDIDHDASKADDNIKAETVEPIQPKDTSGKQMEGAETAETANDTPNSGEPAQEPNDVGAKETDNAGDHEDNVQVSDDSKPSETGDKNVQNDAENKESIEQTSSGAPTEPEVKEESAPGESKDGKSNDLNEKGIVTADGSAEKEIVEDEIEEEDISGLNEDQLRERYGHLQTKYSASELQLNSLREQNAELRTKLKTLEAEPKKTKESLSKSSSATELHEKARQRDGLRVQADYLAHELSQQQDTEKYLREKLTEVLEEKEESERKVKDLQLRLKRFVKDDQAKDERVAKLEGELREISQEVQQLESYIDEETLQKVKRNRSSSDRSGQNGEAGAASTRHQPSPTPQSKTCVLL